MTGKSGWNKNWDRAKKAGKYGGASLGLMGAMVTADQPKSPSQQSSDWYKSTRQAEQRRRSREISGSTRRKNQPTMSEILWGKPSKKARPFF